VLVWPVRVQGETCAVEVASAIAGFNDPGNGARLPRPDLLIVARGGGSLEDLWGFNEEIVVRAAASSAIPLISAVGHETDWTLIDLVADFRAPTPTAAAERAVPVRSELIVTVTSHGLRVQTSLRRRIEGERHRFQGLARGLPRRADILALPHQRFDGAAARLPRALLANAVAHRAGLTRCASRLRPHLLARSATAGRERLTRVDRARRRALGALFERAKGRLDSQVKLLGTLDYHNVLARGFTLVRAADGTVLRHAAQVKPNAALDIEFADGHVEAHADPRPRKAEPEAKEKRRNGGKQGTLL
jgi:exodeoxyribonuclease VII large subunit